MTNIVLPPVTNGNNISTLNDNFRKIQESVNNDLLNLDGGNNVMQQDLDMNGNQLLNIGVDVNNPQSLLTVAAGDSRYYNVSGDTLTGPMSVNGQVISGLAAAIASTSPVRKSEFDAAVFETASALEARLADPDVGDALIGVKQPFTGAVARTQHDKNAEHITPADFGAVGNGVANDDAAFSALEVDTTGKDIDLLGKLYLVTSFPIANRYYNGRFKRVSDGAIVASAYSGAVRVGNTNTLIGKNVASDLTDYSYADPLGSGRGYSLTGYGADCMGSAGNDLYNCEAYGKGAMFSNKYARYNTVFGGEALFSTVGINGDGSAGTRNAVFGSNAMRFNTIGRANAAFGRNANQVATTADECVFLGPQSGAGTGPINLAGIIENPFPRTASNQTAVGTGSLIWSNGVNNTVVGHNAGQNIKLGVANVAIGSQTLAALESSVSPNGNTVVTSALAGTWSQSGTLLTFNMVAHGMSAGFKVAVVLTTGAPQTAGDTQYFTVLPAPGVNTWTATAPDSATRSGNCSRTAYYTLTVATPSSSNTAIGDNSMGNATSGSNNTATGSSALRDNQSSSNSAFGALAAQVITTGTQNTAIGYSALRSSLLGSQNSALGEFALGNLVTGNGNTGIGRSALRTMQDTSLAATITNSTGLGQGASVSGDNQVQLGNSSTTTYVYGTVQNRSDIRDKADVVDTSLGLEFITSLRPVEGRWDMRDDYVEIDDGGNVTRISKDGSKKRQRLHQWFIAQEVKELCDRMGVEFGGYQDHTINGGCDVLSLGYDEFIPPIVKALQELNAKQSSLEARIAALEAKQEVSIDD